MIVYSNYFIKYYVLVYYDLAIYKKTFIGSNIFI